MGEFIIDIEKLSNYNTVIADEQQVTGNGCESGTAAIRMGQIEALFHFILYITGSTASVRRNLPVDNSSTVFISLYPLG